MPITENRNVGFWWKVFNHPEVIGHNVMSEHEEHLRIMLADPKLTPLASEHGGFLLFQRDPFGQVFELHTAFTPEGWGREALLTGVNVSEQTFLRGAAIVFTVEVASNKRSRPPLTFGWQVAGPFVFAPELAAEVRTWVLTRDAWNASPARRRFCQQRSL